MSNRKGHIHFNEFLADIKELAILTLVSLTGSIAAYAAFLNFVPGDKRDAAIAGILVFIAAEVFVLYEIVARSTDEMHSLVTRTDSCRLVAGPRNAKLIQQPDNGPWSGAGIIWLGLNGSPNSSLTISLTQPAGVDLLWKYQDPNSHVWRKAGENPQGITTWTLQLDRTTELETLGQFELSARANIRPEGLSLKLHAMGKGPSGMAIEDSLEVFLLPDIGAVAMKAISLPAVEDQQPTS